MVLVLVAVLLATANRYRPHRDELSFAPSGQRLARGFPDQPALLARLLDGGGAAQALTAVTVAASVLTVTLGIGSASRPSTRSRGRRSCCWRRALVEDRPRLGRRAFPAVTAFSW